MNQRLSSTAELMDWGAVTPSPRGTPEHHSGTPDNCSAGGGGGDTLDNCSAEGGDRLADNYCASSPLITDYLPAATATTGIGGGGATSRESGLDNRPELGTEIVSSK